HRCICTERYKGVYCVIRYWPVRLPLLFPRDRLNLPSQLLNYTSPIHLSSSLLLLLLLLFFSSLPLFLLLPPVKFPSSTSTSLSPFNLLFQTQQSPLNPTVSSR
ncbi:hypothetical protein P168DRAFT_249283, partial [Aspergillus campestris IBT 28561]